MRALLLSNWQRCATADLFRNSGVFMTQRLIPGIQTGIARALMVARTIAPYRCTMRLALRAVPGKSSVVCCLPQGPQFFENATARRLSFLSQPQFWFHHHGMRKPNVWMWNLVARIAALVRCLCNEPVPVSNRRVVIRREN